jgi:hypothetical protein
MTLSIMALDIERIVHAECSKYTLSAECHFLECQLKTFVLSAVMLNVIVLSVTAHTIYSALICHDNVPGFFCLN